MTISLYTIANQIPNSVFWLCRKQATWSLELSCYQGLPLCYLTLLCVLKLVSRAFLKILNESICGGIITRNWYNLEVFIPMLGNKKQHRIGVMLLPATYVSYYNAKCIWRNWNPSVEVLIYSLVRTTAVTLNGFFYHIWYDFYPK